MKTLKSLIGFGLVYFLFSFYSSPCKAQDFSHVRILRDSLQKPLPDTSKIELLRKIGDDFKNIMQDTALLYYKLAFQAASIVNNKQRAAFCLIDIGKVYFNLGSYEKSMTYFLKSLKIFEEFKNKKGIAECYNQIGVVFMWLKNPDKALEYYLKALKLSQETGNKKQLGASLQNIGVFYWRNKDFNQAFVFFQRSLIICEEIGYKNGIVACFGSFANIYSAQINSAQNDSAKEACYSKAMFYMLKALKIAEELNDKYMICQLYYNISAISLYVKKYNESILYANKSLVVAKEIRALKSITGNYECLAVNYDSLHDYAKAYHYLCLWKETNDSLFNDKNSQQLVEMQTLYETGKKESQIKILQKDKELQASQIAREKLIRNLSLSSLIVILLLAISGFFVIRVWRAKEKIINEKKIIELEQKSLLLQMNPHFIFNSLNSINAQMLQNVDTARDFLTKFAKLMRLILENSRESFITVNREFETIRYYLILEQQRLKNFEFSIEIDPEIDAETFEIPPMFIQPHVENAIIHGISKKKGLGRIKVKIEKPLENTLLCVIEDNGIGRKRSSETMVSDQLTHKSLALEITRERLKILSRESREPLDIQISDLENENRQSLGTKITIRLPFRV